MAPSFNETNIVQGRRNLVRSDAQDGELGVRRMFGTGFSRDGGKTWDRWRFAGVRNARSADPPLRGILLPWGPKVDRWQPGHDHEDAKLIQYVVHQRRQRTELETRPPVRSGYSG